MKKVTCKYCHKKWEIEAKDFKKLQICPYCGKEIEKKKPTPAPTPKPTQDFKTEPVKKKSHKLRWFFCLLVLFLIFGFLREQKQMQNTASSTEDFSSAEIGFEEKSGQAEAEAVWNQAETVIYETEALKVVYQGQQQKDDVWFIRMEYQNKTADEYFISIGNSSVRNGLEISCYGSVILNANETRQEPVKVLDPVTYRGQNIFPVQDMMLSFEIVKNDDFKNKEEVSVEIKDPTGLPGPYSYERREGDQVILENEEMSLILADYERDDYEFYVYVYVENRSNQTIRIKAEEFYLLGDKEQKIPAYALDFLEPNTKKFVPVTIYRSDMEEIGCDSIGKFKFDLNVSDENYGNEKEYHIEANFQP